MRNMCDSILDLYLGKVTEMDHFTGAHVVRFCLFRLWINLLLLVVCVSINTKQWKRKKPNMCLSDEFVIY